MWMARAIIAGFAATALMVLAESPSAVTVAAAGAEPHPDITKLYAEMKPLLAGEIDRRDITDPADVYKFLYQGVMGPAHAAVSPATALHWLENEWQHLSQSPDEPAATMIADSLPLIEPLCPSGALVRLNLAPLWQLVTQEIPTTAWPDTGRHTREIVARVFSQTAERWRREPQVLRELWQQVSVDTTLWQGRFTGAEIKQLTAKLIEAEWPAVHHSDIYRMRWEPHYRVVEIELLPPRWTRTYEETR